MRARIALLPLLAFAVWVCLALPVSTQTVTCRALPLEIDTDPGEQLGCSLAAGTAFVVAGSNLADDPQRGIEDAGSVTLVGRSPNGSFSSLTTFAPDAAPGDQFGFAIAVEGGDFAVGARFGDAPGARDAGAVYVFENGDSPITTKITAPHAAPGAQFGAAVALNRGFLAVGAPQDDARGTASGAVYIFRRVFEPGNEQIRWVQQAKLVSSRTAPFDNFGAALALDSIRTPNFDLLWTLAVGTPFADGVHGGEGAVHLFNFQEGEVFSFPWRESQTLTASDAMAGDQLGFSVDLHDDILVAGARRDDHDGLTDAGSVVVFRRDREWSEEARLTANREAQSGDLFGGSVALSFNNLLVGAPLAEGGDGAVHRFVEDDREWFSLGRVLPRPGDGGRFGFSVALNEELAAAGAFAARANAGVVAVLDCSIPVGLTVHLSDGVETVRPGQTVTYQVRIANAPAGTAVRHVFPPQLGQIASCRGEGCTPRRGLRADVLDRGGDAVYTVRGRVRSGAQGRMVYEVRAVPPRGSGASPVRSMDENRILLP
jgi:hypothetical protein